MKVDDLMWGVDECPIVMLENTLKDVILKMTKLPIPYNLGQTTFIFQKNDE